MEPIVVLTVCTGNICRSPVAEHALARHLAARGVPAVIHSSGTQGGLSNDPAMRRAARTAGYDLSSHVSRPNDPAEIGRADLILAMDRGHLEQVVLADPSAWPHTFTLAELVRRADTLPEGTMVETFEDWLELIGAGRTTDDVANGPASDDISDPHGQRMGKYRAAVERIDQLTAQLADLLVAQVCEIAAARTP